MEHIIIFYYIISIAAGTAGTSLFFLENRKNREHIFKYIKWISLIFTMKTISEGLFSYIVLNITVNEEVSKVPIYIQTILNLALFYTTLLFIYKLFNIKMNNYFKIGLSFFTLVLSGVVINFGKIRFEKERAQFSIEFYYIFLYIVIIGCYIIYFYIKNRNKIESLCIAKLFRTIEKAAIILIPIIMIDIMYYVKGEYLSSKENIRFFFYPFVYLVLLTVFIKYTAKDYFFNNKLNDESEDYVNIKRTEENYELLGISLREKEVLNLLRENLSGNEIAEKLYISLSTVKTHTSNIYKKLSVKNRSELIQKLEKFEEGEVE